MDSGPNSFVPGQLGSKKAPSSAPGRVTSYPSAHTAAGARVSIIARTRSTVVKRLISSSSLFLVSSRPDVLFQRRRGLVRIGIVHRRLERYSASFDGVTDRLLHDDDGAALVVATGAEPRVAGGGDVEGGPALVGYRVLNVVVDEASRRGLSPSGGVDGIDEIDDPLGVDDAVVKAHGCALGADAQHVAIAVDA